MDKDTLVRNAVIKALGDAIEGSFCLDVGICHIVEMGIDSVPIFDYDECNKYYSDYNEKLKSLFKSWEFYSGDEKFPVEGSWVEFANNHRWTGKYAERRRDLAIHIINALSRE